MFSVSRSVSAKKAKAEISANVKEAVIVEPTDFGVAVREVADSDVDRMDMEAFIESRCVRM